MFATAVCHGTSSDVGAADRFANGVGNLLRRGLAADVGVIVPSAQTSSTARISRSAAFGSPILAPSGGRRRRPPS